MPSDDGRVIRILAVDSGSATVDANGDGVAESQAALDALGFTPGELAQLAQLYTANQTLMRVPLDHLSIWDFNFNDGPPPDAAPPDTHDRSNEKRRCTCRDCEDGSPADQTTHNDPPIPGTPSDLHYTSERTPGRKGQFTAAARVSGGNPPASVTKIRVELEVAGRRIVDELPPGSNIEWERVWDGKDAYGRLVQGMTSARYRVAYVYPTFYRLPDQTRPRNFGLFANQPLTGSVRTDITFPIYSEWRPIILGTYDARALGLGGYTLDRLHFYSPTQHAVYLGSGGLRGVDGLDGYVTEITTPGGRTTRMAYDAEGLLTSVTDPNGNVASSMTYSPEGLLLQSADAGGGSLTYSRALVEDGFETTMTTAMGRTMKVRITHGLNQVRIQMRRPSGRRFYCACLTD